MSMITENALDYLKSFGRNTVVLIGLTTECCVQATVTDLLDNNYKVVIPVDATSSMTKFERQIALDKLRQEGTVLTSCSSLCSELIKGTNNQIYPVFEKFYSDWLKGNTFWK